MNKRSWTALFVLIKVLVALLVLIACANTQPTAAPTPPLEAPTATIQVPALATVSQASRPRPLLLAHYMPWYQTQAVSGYWGWHWTMEHFHPNDVDEDGRYEIASHYQPLIGPYDSRDDDVLEYHILLMKLSGVDGVLVDWYGIERFWDYSQINAATVKLFTAIQEAGLLFAIVYEDQTIGHMVNNDYLAHEEALSHGQEVMLYLQDKWFAEPAYVQVDERPLLLTFGPQFYKETSAWEALFSVLEKPPVLITLDNHNVAVAEGSFPWPPMWASQAGALSNSALEEYLSTFYQKAENWDYLVASAFPGFHDIYQEAGVRPSYGFLDAQEGETLALTLQTALNHDPDIIQLVTWNDFGEGTMIEPTVEFQYRYLEMIQAAQRNEISPNFPFTAEDLGLPLQLFRLRKLHKGDPDVNGRLDETAFAILNNKPQQARLALDNLLLELSE